MVDRHHYCVVSRGDPMGSRGLGLIYSKRGNSLTIGFAGPAPTHGCRDRCWRMGRPTSFVLRNTFAATCVKARYPRLHQLGQVVAPLARVVLQESLNGSLLEQFARVLSQTDLTRCAGIPAALTTSFWLPRPDTRRGAEFVRLWVRFFAQVFKARSFPDSVLRSFMAEGRTGRSSVTARGCM